MFPTSGRLLCIEHAALDSPRKLGGVLTLGRDLGGDARSSSTRSRWYALVPRKPNPGLSGISGGSTISQLSS